MFTGIVQRVCEIKELVKKDKLVRYGIYFADDLLTGLELGASVANNGVCLTVSAIEGNIVYFDIMQETLKLTNLGLYQVGDFINIERSLKFGSELGGHIVSGHVATTIKIKNIIKTATNTTMIFDLLTIDKNLRKYILQKGFIALNGASLTISDLTQEDFAIHFIPETLNHTTFGKSVVGDLVNLEVDAQTAAIVNTVEAYLAKNL